MRTDKYPRKMLRFWLLRRFILDGVKNLFFIMAMCDNEDSLQFFTELYMRYRSLLFRVASKYICDVCAVEDIIQDSFLKLIEKEELLRTFNGCTLRTYIVYTVRNTAISCVRKKARENLHQTSMDESFETTCVADSAPLPEEVVILDEKKREFTEVWDTLPEDTRELLAGKYILRMSNEELAEEFGCSPDSIRMKLTRARRKALEILREGGFDRDQA